MLSPIARRMLVELLKRFSVGGINPLNDLLTFILNHYAEALGDIRNDKLENVAQDFVGWLIARGKISQRGTDAARSQSRDVLSRLSAWRPERTDELLPLQIELGLEPPPVQFVPRETLNAWVEEALRLKLHEPMPIAALRTQYTLNDYVATSYDPAHALRYLQETAAVANRIADLHNEPTFLRMWLSWADAAAKGGTGVFRAALERLESGRRVVSPEEASPNLDWRTPELSDGLQRVLSGAEADVDLVAFLAGLTRVQRQIGRVRAGGVSGTGFLVGRDTLITNFHVIESALVDGGLPPGSVSVDFDLKPDGSAAVVRSVSALLQARPPKANENRGYRPGDTDLDYAVLTLDQPVGDEVLADGPRGWVVMPWDQPPAMRTQQLLTIPQLPGEKGLRLAFGALSGLDRLRMRYRINTEPGSSGSPVFTLSWALVALHHAGEDQYNRGIPISAILADLQPEVRVRMSGVPASAPEG